MVSEVQQAIPLEEVMKRFTKDNHVNPVDFSWFGVSSLSYATMEEYY